MDSLDNYGNFIREMIDKNLTYSEMSSELSQRGATACSEMSIRRYCKHHNLLRRGQVSDARLECEIIASIGQTGATYGRKLMTGYLSAVRGVKAGESRVGSLLRSIHQPNHEARQRGARNLNPIPYYAAHMGHKMHLDQNEKLAMFGVTHVMAVDGYSSKIVGYATMPVKNNLIIYEEVYRSAVLQYGMWDQVRVDHGKEFYLTLYMQEKLSAYRFNLERQPYVQTKSTNNHTIERMCPEVNNRVNYPIKAALVNMLDQEMINMEDNTTRYCVSNLTMEVCKIGIERLAKAWNDHRIPGKGKPNDLAAGGCPKRVDQALLPLASQAADLYQQDLGSSLTRMPSFASDPFSTEQEKVLAENHFAEYCPDLTALHDSVVNNDYHPFQDALLCLIHTAQH